MTAARRGAISSPCKQLIELAQAAVDDDGGSEFAGIANELGGDGGGVAFFPPRGGMPETKAGCGIGDGHAAAASTRSAMKAVRRSGGFVFFFQFEVIHWSFLSKEFHIGKNVGIPGSFQSGKERTYGIRKMEERGTY